MSWTRNHPLFSLSQFAKLVATEPWRSHITASAALGLQMGITMPIFIHGFWWWNSGSQACPARTLHWWSEPSPQRLLKSQCFPHLIWNPQDVLGCSRILAPACWMLTVSVCRCMDSSQVQFEAVLLTEASHLLGPWIRDFNHKFLPSEFHYVRLKKKFKKSTPLQGLQKHEGSIQPL